MVTMKNLKYSSLIKDLFVKQSVMFRVPGNASNILKKGRD